MGKWRRRWSLLSLKSYSMKSDKPSRVAKQGAFHGGNDNWKGYWNSSMIRSRTSSVHSNRTLASIKLRPLGMRSLSLSLFICFSLWFLVLHHLRNLLTSFFFFNLKVGVLIKSVNYALSNLKKWMASQKVRLFCLSFLSWNFGVLWTWKRFHRKVVAIVISGSYAMGFFPFKCRGVAWTSWCCSHLLLLEFSHRFAAFCFYVWFFFLIYESWVILQHFIGARIYCLLWMSDWVCIMVLDFTQDWPWNH